MREKAQKLLAPFPMSFLEVTPGFEPGNQGFADPCLTTWLCHRLFQCPHFRVGIERGAGNEARTRYLHLGKVALYQMSYARKWCPEPESNQRHEDFQSSALPTELSGQNGNQERTRTNAPLLARQKQSEMALLHEKPFQDFYILISFLVASKSS